MLGVTDTVLVSHTRVTAAGPLPSLPERPCEWAPLTAFLWEDLQAPVAVGNVPTVGWAGGAESTPSPLQVWVHLTVW